MHVSCESPSSNSMVYFLERVSKRRTLPAYHTPSSKSMRTSVPTPTSCPPITSLLLLLPFCLAVLSLTSCLVSFDTFCVSVGVFLVSFGAFLASFGVRGTVSEGACARLLAAFLALALVGSGRSSTSLSGMLVSSTSPSSNSTEYFLDRALNRETVPGYQTPSSKWMRTRRPTATSCPALRSASPACALAVLPLPCASCRCCCCCCCSYYHWQLYCVWNGSQQNLHKTVFRCRYNEVL
mmetsp:Transcript_72590/g.106392  ORF Transcript_72590/g.106392 Transcript_72590/m.106392 type:complete len:238 (-) Transcript_72590:610-1323(-)